MDLQPLQQDVTIPLPIPCSSLNSITNHTQSAIIAPIILVLKELSNLPLRLQIRKLRQRKFDKPIKNHHIPTQLLPYKLEILLNILPKRTTCFAIDCQH